ncbi:hypothetical protein [Paracoccus laeviglucosivorans]|uniref:Uncharacterized protein n=1 Tax=Paracoccus laeviglucosivorans TaxID=1197861 RepID=A0A521CXH3_9RHOB|nr:hypothetical protein [Paracoccus laeviglucosivorans]SMO64102.1 hypothetical protein SAMN06265221_105249 [Paracoccus laeviglucosivorans]
MIDARAEVLGIIRLAEVTTAGGVFRFILGLDGRFIDVNGQVWIGSTLLDVPELEMLVGDIAPSGSITITYLQDPDGPDFVGQMKQLGLVYVEGLPVRFYAQPFTDLSQVGAPVEPPELIATRRQTGLTYTVDGPAQRSITLTFETLGASGNHQPRLIYNTEDHAALIGRANPSLQYIPQEIENDEPLFG